MDTHDSSLPFAGWQLESTWTDQLPMDPSRTTEPRHVDAFGAFVRPSPTRESFPLAVSSRLADALNFEGTTDPGVLTGSTTIAGFDAYSTNYGGHQFGNWADQLGDGRAITVAEMRNAVGQRQELQLKGGGLTPFSRFADGRAVLRSSVREYIASESMAALGVPSTRALWLAGTGEPVLRDRFYDGHPAPESGAVVCRVAPSWIRFGHFELPAARGQVDRVKQLADFCITRDFPGLSYADWFGEICKRTALMIAKWQAVGFVHAVMNTDNMSVSGLTIDYGPFGFMDLYDPTWTPNTTDRPARRYRYAQQPAVGFWNLQRLAMAISSLFGDDMEPLQQGLVEYERTFVAEDARLQSAKLGLTTYPRDVIEGFHRLMAEQQLDFRRAYLAVQNDTDLAAESYRPDPDRDAIALWIADYRVARASHSAEFAGNPLVLPHNWILQELIDAAQLAYDERRECPELALFLNAMNGEMRGIPAHWLEKRPSWASTQRGCTDLSCSS